MVTQRVRSDVAFRAAFELALDAMLIADDGGRFVEVNAAAAELYGRTREELLALSVFDLVANADASRRGWQQFLEHGKITGELETRRPNGEIRILQYASRAHIGPGLHLSIVRDVTRERRAEQELRRSEELFVKAFRASPSVMVLSSLVDGRVIDVNDAAIAFAGRTREEMIGMPGASLGVWIDPEERARFSRLFRERSEVRDFTARMRDGAGSVRQVVVGLEHLEVRGEACTLTVITDITKQRATELLLEETESVGRVGSWTRDLRTGGAHWSDETCRILGVTEPIQSIDGWMQLVAPEDRARVHAERERAWRGRDVYVYDFRIVRPSGERRWVQCRGRTELDASGVPIRVIGVLQDITDEREAQDRLRRSEELFAKAFRASPVAIAIVALDDSRIIDINDAALVFAGRTREEMVGRTTAEIGLWLDLADRERIKFELREKRVLHDVPVQMSRKSGEIRHGVLAVELVVVAGELCMLVVITDITEKRETERLLEEAQSIGNVGSWSIDLQSGVVRWSDETGRILGWSGPPATLEAHLARVHPDDVRLFEEGFARLLRDGAGTIPDYRYVRPDGQLRWVSSNGKVHKDASGVAVRASGSVQDITERHESAVRLAASEARYRRIVETTAQGVISIGMEREITFANGRAAEILQTTVDALVGTRFYEHAHPAERAGLVHRREKRIAGITETYDLTLVTVTGQHVTAEVTATPLTDDHGQIRGGLLLISDVTERRRAEEVRAQLAASLREAEDHLRQAQKMEAIGALAGGIAHDFNNILSVVLSSATLIQEAVDVDDPIVEDARAIQEAAERAATLTRQLLAFSRRQVLAPRVVNLDKVIAGMEKMLRRLLRERIDLVITTGRPANVLIDPSQFEQVILNLVVNARDAMPDGGELVIDSDTVALPEGAFMRVRVADTGVGMDEATRARMFEPFFTTKDKGKGTGLGLATVFGIVRQSGGFVRVESVPGKGTAIEVYVPITDRIDGATKTGPLPLSKQAQGETILLVEDEEPVRKLVQKLLRRQGYHVMTAANAGEALLIAEQKPAIDLLLTDVVMPLMNGRVLAERFRALYPGLRVVFMSGYHDDEVLRDMLGDRDVAYLQKPVPRDTLVRCLRDVLDRR